MTHQSFRRVSVVLLALLLTATAAAAQEQPTNSNPLGSYSPLYDVAPPYGSIDVADIGAVAGSWATSGPYSSGTDWSLAGNAGTDAASHFLGTTDDQALVVRTNNAEAMRVSANGNVSIGTASNLARLTVKASPAGRGIYLYGGPTVNPAQLAAWHTQPTSGDVTLPMIAVDSYSTAGGYGFLLGANVASPMVWMYGSTGRNAFTVAKKSGSGDPVSEIGDKLTPLLQVREDGKVGIGTTDPQAKLDVAGTTRTNVLQIDGGSDLAEPFEVAGGKLEPGTVVAIDAVNPGQLRVADRAYDRTVAGCVSGAGGVQPGLVMRQEGTAADGTLPVALSGRVYCLADASSRAIQPGDLLTTSDTPGHAMAVADHGEATGAIIGKAMTGLDSGQGLVLVLVSLQ